MKVARTLTESILRKIDEQAERTVHLCAKASSVRLDTRHAPSAMSLADLLLHLIEAFTGFCAVVSAAHPDRDLEIEEVRAAGRPPLLDARDAAQRLNGIHSAFLRRAARLQDGDLCRVLPSVFRPEGETVLFLLLNNLEHVINHKHQLFATLKQSGVALTTADLYSIREAGNAPRSGPSSG